MKDQKNILNDLRSKGTGFSIPDDYLDHFDVEIPAKENNSLPERNGFKLPEGYLNQFEKKILERIATGIPKETGFGVPAGYFNDFEIKTKETHKNKIIDLYEKYRKSFIALAVAASILLIFSIYPFLNTSNSMDLSSLNENDIETWLILSSDEFYNTEMDDAIDDEVLYAADMISEEDISDYLMQTDLERWLPDN